MTNTDHLAAGANGGHSTAPLPAGAPAPAFVLRSGRNAEVALRDLGGRPLVIVFFVGDWHPVCMVQLSLYRDLMPDIEALGADLVAISTDSIWCHGAFAREQRLPFSLLADDRPRGAVAKRYGVYDEQNETSRRAIFVLDGEGLIRWSAAYPAAVDPGADGIFTALEALASGATEGGA